LARRASWVIRRIRHVLAPLGGVALVQVEQRLQRVGDVVDRGVPVPLGGEARGHRGDGEVLGRDLASSSQPTGAETGAPGLGRMLYAEAMVRSRAFWL
jgi:hypothetical protein